MLAWAIQLGVAAILTCVPLFNLLAYEFCLAMACVTACTAPYVAAACSRGALGPGQAGAAAARACLGHILPPLAIMAANGLRVQNCNMALGLGFWLLLPMATAAYGGTLGWAVSRVGKFWCRSWRGLALGLMVAAPLASCFVALYRQPPIFVYDHLWGFFAGSLYDESIHIDARLLTFRLGTALRIVATVAAVMAWEYRHLRGMGPTTAALAGALAVAVVYEATVGPAMGFVMGRRQIQHHLPIAVHLPGLVVHLPKDTPVTQQQRIAADHAFRLQALQHRLAVVDLPVIHSYVYRNADDKAFYMGGRNTMVAKPWLAEIHTHGLEVPHAVMPHEMAHAVTAAFGSWGLRLSARYGLWVNMGLVEGVAQALTPDRDALDLHHWARALSVLGMAPDMQRIVGFEGFWQEAPRRAYTQAGSFVRYLLDTYGAEPLQRAYPYGDFSVAYGRPLTTLVHDWQAFLATLGLTEAEKHAAEERFSTPSIFSRTCAHEIAALDEAATGAEADAAVDLRRQIAAHLGHAPAAEMAVALAQLQAGDTDGYLAAADRLLAAPGLSVSQRARLQQATCAALWRTGHPQQAANCANALAAMPTDAAMQRLAWVQQWAMQGPEALRDDLMQLIDGRLEPVVAAARLGELHGARPLDKTSAYLLGRQLAVAQAPEDALRALQAASGHPFAPIELERLRLVASLLASLDRFEAARAAWQALAVLTPSSGLKAQAQDGLARAAWSLAPRGAEAAVPPPTR